MCGILAAYSRNEESRLPEGRFSEMLNELRFRGPDESQSFHDKNVFLGHTRLSIIDLTSGSQPIWNEDRTVACIFNGEIYNFIELREQLQKKGHTFKTTSDTEVIVHLYEEKGEEVFTYLNGMFAIVLYDSKKKMLLAARDRIGEKPLVYFDSDRLFLCASELKALLKDPNIPRRIDPAAVEAYLRLLYIPAPLSIFQDIKKLPPAHYLKVTQKGTTQHQYWNPNIEIDRTRGEEEILEEFIALFNDSVRNKMISDVPIGAFLSGGIDSSSVVAFMARNSARPIKTFSVGFDVEVNELPYARRVAERYQTDHTEIHVQSDIRAVLPKVVAYYDEPFADNSNVPTYLISKAAREHVKVVLTGDGGDELFAGYSSYLTQRYYSNSRVVSKILSTLNGASLRFFQRTCLDRLYLFQPNRGSEAHWRALKEYFSPAELKRLFHPSLLESSHFGREIPWLRFHANDPLSQAFSHDFNWYLPDDLLKKVDMASMAFGLECRAPFLDYRLIEFSMKISPEMKIKNDQTKYLLKKGLKDYLPDEILYREKQGFGAPIGFWMENELKETVQDALSPGCKIESLFSRNEIVKILEEGCSGNAHDWRSVHKLWLLLILELWMRTYR